MKLDIFSATGTKKEGMDLPEDLFGAPVNWGLMHQAVILQQSNRRAPIAHVKTRGEVVGSTKKLFAQKHTGRARRGPGRSPVLKGGGKAFGPRNDANFIKAMPQKMRHAALRSCLSLQAEKGGILLLEDYPDDVKTKNLAVLLQKMSVEHGRRALIVLPGKHRGLQMSSRNITGVKAIQAAYLNPEDVLNSRKIVFLVDAIKVAQETFGKDATKREKSPENKEEKAPKAKKTPKIIKKTTKKTSTKA